MTQKERFLTALRGERPDRIPWACNFDHWLNVNRQRGTAPKEFEGVSRDDICRAIGAAIWARAGVFKSETPNVKATQRAHGDSIITTYETPVGSIWTRHQTASDFTRAQFLKEHAIKTPQDIEVQKFIIQDEIITPAYEGFVEAERAVREDGIALTGVGYSPFQAFMIRLAGWVNGVYLLNDYPEKVEELLEVIEEKALEACRIAADSPAKVVAIGDNMDARTTSPRYYQRYLIPFYRKAAAILHAKGKIVESHYDAPVRALLPLIPETDLDVVEAVPPIPMGDCTMGEAYKALRPRVALQGGVPAVFVLRHSSPEVLKNFIIQVIEEVQPGDGFVLGMADNVPPDANFDLVKTIAPIVEEYGRLG
jgi:uroporphyrinogen-III decarboxylase